MFGVLRRQWLGAAALALAGGHLGWDLARGSAAPGPTPTPPPTPDFAALFEQARGALVTVLVDRDHVAPDALRAPGGFVQGRTGGSAGRAPRPRDRQGSGFIVRDDGLVVTNLHVIEGGEVLRIALPDGRVLPARRLGSDPLTDLAVLLIEGGSAPWQVLAFRQGAPPAPGEPVLALGAPLGYAASATAGIVSGHGRAYDALDPADFLQHDAAINPGSSGGPLLDRNGRVAGVNTAVPDVARLDIGVALALPAALVAPVVAELAARGHVRRAWLGLEVQSVGRELAEALDLPAAGEGLLVVGALPGAPAAQAGLAPGDHLLAADGQALRHVRDLPRALLRRAPGEMLSLRRARGAAVEDVAIRLGETTGHAPREPVRFAATAEAAASPEPVLGASLALPPRTRGSAPVPGVVVEALDPDGRGAAEGFRPGDLLIAIGREPTTTPEQAAALLAAVAVRQRPLALLVRRNTERARYLVIEYSDRFREASDSVSSIAGGPY